METYERKVSEALLQIEAEMRRLSLWENEPPSAEALRSNQPFCCDTLDFPQWVQWILLPRMWRLVEQAGPYPPRCGIYVYAEEWAVHRNVDSLALLGLIRSFDVLIEGRSTSGMH